MPAVSLEGVGKKYRVFASRQERLKELLSFGRAERSHDLWALENINLTVESGTTLGILGRNGAGKSTLLKIISGVLQPTSGTVEVNGRLAALFGVGAGQQPQPASCYLAPAQERLPLPPQARRSPEVC